MRRRRVLHEIFSTAAGQLHLQYFVDSVRAARLGIETQEDRAWLRFRELGSVVGLRDALNELIDKWEEPGE